MFAPSLATDVAAALALPSTPRAPSRAAGLSPPPAAGGTAGAVGSAASASAPLCIILGGLGGGGIRIPPPPPSLAPFPQPEGRSAVGALVAPGGGAGTAERSILRDDDDDVSLSLDDSNRYHLESPRKGAWQGGARGGNGTSGDGSSGGKSHLWRLQVVGRRGRFVCTTCGVVLLIHGGSDFEPCGGLARL